MVGDEQGAALGGDLVEALPLDAEPAARRGVSRAVGSAPGGARCGPTRRRRPGGRRRPTGLVDLGSGHRQVHERRRWRRRRQLRRRPGRSPCPPCAGHPSSGRGRPLASGESYRPRPAGDPGRAVRRRGGLGHSSAGRTRGSRTRRWLGATARRTQSSGRRGRRGRRCRAGGGGPRRSRRARGTTAGVGRALDRRHRAVAQVDETFAAVDHPGHGGQEQRLGHRLAVDGGRVEVVRRDQPRWHADPHRLQEGVEAKVVAVGGAGNRS